MEIKTTQQIYIHHVIFSKETNLPRVKENMINVKWVRVNDDKKRIQKILDDGNYYNDLKDWLNEIKRS